MNGDNSLLVNFNENPNHEYRIVDLFRLSEGTYENGEYTITCNCYKVSGSFSAVFFNQGNITRIDNIPNGEYTISLSGTVSNQRYFSLRIITSATAIAYFDNILLQIQ